MFTVAVWVAGPLIDCANTVAMAETQLQLQLSNTACQKLLSWSSSSMMRAGPPVLLIETARRGGTAPHRERKTRTPRTLRASASYTGCGWPQIMRARACAALLLTHAGARARTRAHAAVAKERGHGSAHLRRCPRGFRSCPRRSS